MKFFLTPTLLNVNEKPESFFKYKVIAYTQRKISVCELQKELLKNEVSTFGKKNNLVNVQLNFYLKEIVSWKK
jgi:hypothetical protein